MLYSEQMKEIIEKLGVDPSTCKDGLYSTLLQTISDACDGGGGGGSSEEEWIGDGNTHIWISLPEGRTSPVLGIGVNGTVTVDWGDGSAPNTITGTRTDTAVYTPVHEYAKPGDYVITLSGGEICVLGGSYRSILLVGPDRGSSSVSNAYRNSAKKVELGSNVTSIGQHAFREFYSLASVRISDGVTSIGEWAFYSCSSLASVHIPDSVVSIGERAFYQCYSLASVHIPDGVTSIGGSAFYQCYALASVRISDSVTSIGGSVFYNCYALASVHIPDGVTSIGGSAFSGCYALASVHISDSVTSIGGSAFSDCYAVKFYDFTNHTSVPTLSATSAFSYGASDCEIRVPAALVNEWKAATNWSTYADKIVGV